MLAIRFVGYQLCEGVTEESEPYTSPYRTAAKIPEPIQQQKPKREFKMPSFKLGKHIKSFGFVI